MDLWHFYSSRHGMDKNMIVTAISDDGKNKEIENKTEDEINLSSSGVCRPVSKLERL